MTGPLTCLVLFAGNRSASVNCSVLLCLASHGRLAIRLTIVHLRTQVSPEHITLPCRFHFLARIVSTQSQVIDTNAYVLITNECMSGIVRVCYRRTFGRVRTLAICFFLEWVVRMIGLSNRRFVLRALVFVLDYSHILLTISLGRPVLSVSVNSPRLAFM